MEEIEENLMNFPTRILKLIEHYTILMLVFSYLWIFTSHSIHSNAQQYLYLASIMQNSYTQSKCLLSMKSGIIKMKAFLRHTLFCSFNTRNFNANKIILNIQ